jgi:gamma-D-glutamyl-L-lysine dipeptidyl-peptidase
MKNFYKKTGCLFLLLCAGTIVMAQTLSYKTLSQELQSPQKQIVPDKQVSFIDSLRLLPDSSLGDKTWALATLSVSNLRTQPDHTSELVSQTLMGTPMKVLDSNNGWYRVQTPEHYIGWMDTAGLQRVTQKELDSWKRSNRYLYNSMLGYAYNAPGKKGEIVTDLVLDDLFEVEAEVKGFLRIKIPDGRTAYVRKADCISFDDWSYSQPNVQSVLSFARQMMGSPYLWGGASSKAVDCSGFVKLVYYTQGIILARDASQQARHGEPIDFSNMNNLKPGDLLFFGSSEQQISHVGIYLGKGNFIHASGRVHISSIDPGDPKYNINRKNVAACRILNSLNTEGIVRVKDHPWYTVQP